MAEPIDPLSVAAPVNGFEQYDSYAKPIQSLAQLSRGIYNFPAGAVDLIGLASRGIRLAGVPGMDRTIQNLDDASQGWRDMVSNFTRIPEGHSWHETIPEAVGQAIVPIPGGPIAALTQNAGKAGRVAAKITDAVLLPGTHNPTMANLGTNAALAGLIDQGAQAYMGNPDTLMNSVNGALGVKGARAAEPIDPFSVASAPTDPLGVTTHTAPADPYDPLGIAVGGTPQVAEKSWWHDNSSYVVGGLAGAAMMAGALMKFRRYGSPPMASMTDPALPAVKPDNATSLSTVIRKGTVDAEAPLYGSLTEGPIKDEVQWRLHRQTRQGAQASAVEFAKTGQSPGASTASAPAFSQILTDVGAWDGAKLDTLNKYMLSQTELERRAYARTVPGAKSGVMPGMSWASDSDLRSNVLTGAADPDVVNVADRLRRNYDAVLEHGVNRGMLSRSQVNTWQRVNRNYAPLAETEPGALSYNERIKQLLGGDTNIGQELNDAQHTMTRSLIEGGGAQNPLNVVQASEQYLVNMMSAIEKNDATRFALRALTTDTNTRGVVKQVPVGGDYSIMDRGVTKHYKVDDPYILKALQVDPYITNAFTGTMRKLWTSGVTGKAWPFFSIGKSWLYDVPMVAMMRPSGMATGYLDYGMQRLTGGRFGMPLDPTTYVASLQGTAKHILSNQAYNTSLALRDAVNRNTFLARALGPAHVQSWSDSLMSRYMNSVLHDTNRYGGIDVSLYKDSVNGMQSYIDSIRGTPLASLYGHVLEGFQSGVRLGMVDLTRSLPTGLSMREAVSHARNAVGDVTRSGDANWYRQFAEAVPFLNVAVQEGARMTDFMKKNPGRALTSVILGMAMPKVMENLLWSSMSDDHREYYHKHMPDYVRSTHWTLPKPGGGPSDYYSLPMPPGFAPIADLASNMVSDVLSLRSGPLTPVVQNIRQMLGISNKQPSAPGVGETGAEKYNDFWLGVKNYLVPPVPPVLQAAVVAATGQKIDPANPPGEMGQRLSQERTSGLSGGGKVFDDILGIGVQGLLSSVFGTVADALVSAARDGRNGLARNGVNGMLENLGQNVGMTTEKALPFMFSGSLNDSTFTKQKQLLQKKGEGIDALNKEAQLIATSGTSRNRSPGGTVVEGDRPDYSVDPAVAAAAGILRNYSSAISTRRTEIDNTRGAILNTQSSQSQKPREVRDRSNELKRQEMDQTEALLALVRSIEAEIAQATGQQAFKFEDISTGKRR
jgi:hypothetical protein